MTNSTSPWSEAPMLVFWELTQACELTCTHCRAEAQPDLHPDELSTDRIREQLVRLGEAGTRLVVFTGGDPLERPDLLEIVDAASDAGIKPILTPASSSKLTESGLAELIDAGLAMIALSMDGDTPERHDRFRREEGSYERTYRALQYLNEREVPVQINTTVCERTLPWLENIGQILAGYELARWAWFYLVRTGRGQELSAPGASQTEASFQRLQTWSDQFRTPVKTTNAPHFRRWQVQQEHGSRRPGAVDGDGVVFVSHRGVVYPSGFLKWPLGSLRSDDLVSIYRRHELLESIRKRELKGKCGVCEFRRVCGGSRANAWAETGDPLASDPRCSYEPQVASSTVGGHGEEMP